VTDEEKAKRAENVARISKMEPKHAAWCLLHHLWSHTDQPYVKAEWKALEKAICALGARPQSSLPQDPY
jgi:hypothetical protein